MCVRTDSMCPTTSDMYMYIYIYMCICIYIYICIYADVSPHIYRKCPAQNAVLQCVRVCGYVCARVIYMWRFLVCLLV